MFPYLVFLPLLPSLGCAFRLLLFVVSWSLVLSACGLVFWLCLSSESSVCSFVSSVAVFLVVLVLLLSSRVVLCSNVNPYDIHVACSLLSLSFAFCAFAIFSSVLFFHLFCLAFVLTDDEPYQESDGEHADALGTVVATTPQQAPGPGL